MKTQDSDNTSKPLKTNTIEETSKKPTTTLDQFPSEGELRDVLMWAEDVMARCQIPFVVLGTAAYQIYHDLPLEVPKITVGVLHGHDMDECTSLLKAVDPSVEFNMDGWTITKGSAKVVVRVLTKQYKTLKDPDKHWYWVEPFQIPNPFEEYWKGEDHYDV